MRAVIAALLLLLLAGCESAGPVKSGITRLELPPSAVEVAPKPRKAVRGALLYVPCYSHVYLLEGKPYNLAITLSLRNTSRNGKLIVQSVAYYDSQGRLLKEMAPKEIEMAPMSVAEVVVHEEDRSGGSGASFLVRWVAESDISEPVVEAAMVGTSGSLGVSFLTSSRVLESLPPAPAATPTPDRS